MPHAFTRGATCSRSRRLSKGITRSRRALMAFVTRSKHKIGYDTSWKTDYQWYIPVYDSSASTVVGLLFSVCKQHGTKQRNSARAWTDKLYTLSPPPPYVKISARTLLASFPGPHTERGRRPGDTWQNSRMCSVSIITQAITFLTWMHSKSHGR